LSIDRSHAASLEREQIDRYADPGTPLHELDADPG